jgi:RimJ/RimL family protein N-acetyltransferase
MGEIGPTLETARLILRPPNGQDFARFAAFMSDEAASKFVGGPQSPSAAWRSLATFAGAWALNGFSMFSWIEKESGRWVGRGGPWAPEGWPGTEVGWATSVDARRKGYAKEAATAAIDWAFDRLGWTEVIHCIDPANAPSIAVARSLGSGLLRTGVTAPAPIVGVTWDIYGQTREQWRAARAGK